ncbi:hypothetical protein AVEN_122113-1 [Araneus ventricosus]|uniref:Uncharacterized protein n=1 Tax=Araneus ventricosus TaxID=182803 RepID=A0A4Y2WN25_ARAVE|nr:hypothetical protein AVEN_122113-1 [Araneus ventricosus]
MTNRTCEWSVSEEISPNCWRFLESRLKQMDLPKVTLGDFDFTTERVEENKPEERHANTTETNEDEEEFMRKNQLIEEDEEPISAKRSLEDKMSEEDENVIEAIPNRFKRTCPDNVGDNEQTIQVEESLLYLD